MGGRKVPNASSLPILLLKIKAQSSPAILPLLGPGIICELLRTHEKQALGPVTL